MRTLAAAVAIVVLLATAACGRDQGGAQAELQQRLAQTELEAFAVSVVDRRNMGALPELMASALADRLVAEMNAPRAPARGEPADAGKTKFVYARDTGNGPWQIVLRADDRQSTIVTTAYGATAGAVLATRTITLD